MDNKYDVIIIGGGTSGVCAAAAFINSSYKIAIIEKCLSLGGTTTNSLVCTWIEGPNLPFHSDIFTELKLEGEANGNIDKSWVPNKFNIKGDSSGTILNPDKLKQKYLKFFSKYSNIDVFLNYTFIDIDKIENKNIKKIKIENNITHEIHELESKFFIDCSGVGSLCKTAADKLLGNGLNKFYYLGRDSKIRFNEDLAQNHSDVTQLNEPSLFFELKVGQENINAFKNIKNVYAIYKDKMKSEIIDDETFLLFDKFKKKNYNLENIHIIRPDYLNADGYLFSVPSKNNVKYYCNPMTGTGVTGYDCIIKPSLDLERLMLNRTKEFWKFIKYSLLLANRKGETGFWSYTGWRVNEHRFCMAENKADLVGIREAYRIQCDEMLSQNDLITDIRTNYHKRFIAIGTHNVDMHNQCGLYGIADFNRYKLRPYGIKYDCLAPIFLNNTLISCKAFGASQIAISSARIIKTISQLGWISGMAIKLCLDKHLNTVRLDDLYIEELKSDKYSNFENYFKIFISKLNF